MCGIAGFCDFSNRSSEHELRRMMSVLKHRGPDDSGLLFQQTETAQVGLGHRRLSIIDLSPRGRQPMSTPNGRQTIVLNGEIYNFREIRAQLEERGEVFESESDTEVALRAYAHWGIDGIHRFIGMFAIAIFDQDARKLLLVRDRAGVKPLYYSWCGRQLLFASELKSLREHDGFPGEINEAVIPSFLRYGFVPGPHSIFTHTHKLQPGHYLEVDLRNEEISVRRYWSAIDCYNRPKIELDEEEAAQQLEELLISACTYRLVSDVPVGVFLSGGYDSTTVAALLQSRMSKRLRTFTIGFEESAYDEAPHARRVAEHLGTDHTEHYCSREDAAAIIPTLPTIFDEPFADTSAIPTILVSRLARNDVTVALSADGGDETFAGYVKYTHYLDLYRRIAALPSSLKPLLRPLVVPFAKLPIVRDIHNADGRAALIADILAEPSEAEIYRHKIEPRFYTQDELLDLLVAPPSVVPSAYDNFSRLNSHNDGLARMLAVDYQTYLADDILTKVDRATMSVGLEGREPLLDHRILEFAARLPSNLKLKDGVQKYLLRKVLHRYVPQEIVERPKMGFSIPIHEWFRDDLKELFTTYLSEDRMREGGIFNGKEVVRLRDRYLSNDSTATHESGQPGQPGNRSSFEKCWHLLVFEMWKERWA